MFNEAPFVLKVGEIWCEKHYTMFQTYRTLLPASLAVISAAVDVYVPGFALELTTNEETAEKLREMAPLCECLPPERFRSIEVFYLPLN